MPSNLSFHSGSRHWLQSDIRFRAMLASGIKRRCEAGYPVDNPTLGGALVVLGICVAMVAIATPVRYSTWIDATATIAIDGVTLDFGTGAMLPMLYVAKVVLIGALFPARRRSRWAGMLCAAVCAPLVLFSIWNTVAVLPPATVGARRRGQHGHRVCRQS